ncbi:flagellar basal body P-ring formation chaperone FlgA [Microbaculum marinisediminis]|uniref:Flagellar basal body P-ring formation chaperone FlgA n=1 Tax=Microbaculum marinisediminis TaxID=2931392 RepID=A0AAW5QXX2_9HYPH|nr:flagellar basal body P-ring formation chaperone FlgA [Microbaculum sp. A6E488]MCT8972825.1 flagellar basal body P-ring formation chaperone FlgA [Microbaculum sp. A6E488]
MIIRTLVVGAALAVAVFALPAMGAEQPRLKAQVTVHGPLVTLGDLIDGAGAASGIAVFRAPDLGTAGTVRVDRILTAAQAQGLAGLDTGGLDSVSVSRLGRAIASDEIVQAITRHIVETGRGDRPEDIDVTLDRFEQPIVVEQSAMAPLSVDKLEYDPATGRFAALLAVADSRAAGTGLRFSGRAVEIIEVPVLARALERGEVISPRDIVIDRLPRSAVRSEMIVDADRLTGMSARRHLRDGVPLTADLLMEPILVHRGDLVTIIYRTPGLTLTTRGRALSAGARGEVIQVFNIQSKRTVEAEISGPGFVTVLPQRVPVASLPTTVR